MLLLQFININEPPCKISAGTLSLGHDPSNDVVIKAAGISDFHAEITLDADRIFISDLFSESGTYVNEKKISRNKELQPWDRIKLATIEIEICEAEKHRPGEWALKQPSDLLSSQYLPLQGVTSVGRNADCDIVILDGLLSRHHARLTIDAGRLLVEDLNSANGTYINQIRIDKSYASPGDDITFDKITFKLQGPSPTATAIGEEDHTIIREQDYISINKTESPSVDQLESGRQNETELLGETQLKAEPDQNETVFLAENSPDPEDALLTDVVDDDRTQIFQPTSSAPEATQLFNSHKKSEKSPLLATVEKSENTPRYNQALGWGIAGFVLTLLIALLFYFVAPS